MNSFFKSKHLVHLFILLFTLLSLYAFLTYKHFLQTKEEIIQNHLRSNIAYIDSITSNLRDTIVHAIGTQSPLKALATSHHLRESLEKDLQLFETNRYRYIYVLYKEKKGKPFRFLLDGSQKDKADFLETFQPLQPEAWDRVYTTKKANYFINDKVSSLWLTYLKPIIQDGKVTAVITIDFSLEEQHTLQRILKELSRDMMIFTVLSILIFILIILHLLYERKKVTMLNQQAEEIQAFNETLQQRVEEEVAKNREKDKQILHQARLVQMGEMLGMIAHQWRQPLSAISSTNIAINFKAQMDELDAQTAIELTEKIEEFTQHLSHTIDDFRNFFKSTKVKKKTRYNEIIDSTLKIVQGSLKHNSIELITDLQSDKVFETYPSELKQVLLNLIKNAEDILVEKKVKKPYIKIITRDIILQVADNGGGIPKEIMEKIFDPYFSTKDLNGTGLGLYMSKTIVEEHCGGKLSISNSKEGAVFTIELT